MECFFEIIETLLMFYRQNEPKLCAAFFLIWEDLDCTSHFLAQVLTDWKPNFGSYTQIHIDWLNLTLLRVLLLAEILNVIVVSFKEVENQINLLLRYAKTSILHLKVDIVWLFIRVSTQILLRCSLWCDSFHWELDIALLSELLRIQKHVNYDPNYSILIIFHYFRETTVKVWHELDLLVAKLGFDDAHYQLVAFSQIESFECDFKRAWLYLLIVY